MAQVVVLSAGHLQHELEVATEEEHTEDTGGSDQNLSSAMTATTHETTNGATINGRAEQKSKRSRGFLNTSVLNAIQ